MRITIEVVGGTRFGYGKAIVKIDGKEYARLRTDESYVIETRQSCSTEFVVKPETPLVVGNGRQDCEWCKGDVDLCDGDECQK